MPRPDQGPLPAFLFSRFPLSEKQLPLFLMSCPGVRFEPEGQQASEELLERDLDRLEAEDTRLIVSCLQEGEFELGREAYARGYARRAIAWHNVPIENGNPPTSSQEILLDHAFSLAELILEAGGAVAVHCLGGIGRTGMIAARFAINYGDSPAAAMHRVRCSHHEDAIATHAQRDYLRSLTASPAPAA